MINYKHMLNDFIDCGISEKEAAKYFKYCLGDELLNSLNSIAGELVLDNEKLMNIGVSSSDIKALRYINLIIAYSKDTKF